MNPPCNHHLILSKTAFDAHAATFATDGNHTLVTRLRQNVIRAGLRNISLAYSKISLADVAAKLCACGHPASHGCRLAA